MRWKQAVEFVRDLGCPHAAQNAKKGNSDAQDDNAEAVVLCKEKVRRGWSDDECDMARKRR